MKKKKMSEQFPHIWKSEAAWWNYIRGCLRKAWVRHPVKIEFIRKKRERVLNPKTGNMVWGGTCNICKVDMLAKDLQVDHLKPAGKLSSLSDISQFVENLLFVGLDDLQYVCKECHRSITYSQAHDITLEEAIRMRKIINIMKEKKDKEVLEDMGVEPASTQAGRRAQLEKHFKL